MKGRIMLSVLVTASFLLLGACEPVPVGSEKQGDEKEGTSERGEDWKRKLSEKGEDLKGALSEKGEDLRESMKKTMEQVGEKKEALEEEIRKIGSFEYRIIEINALSPEEIVEILNEAGKERWECFFVEDRGGMKRFYMKRPPSSILKYIPHKELLRIVTDQIMPGGE